VNPSVVLALYCFVSGRSMWSWRQVLSRRKLSTPVARPLQTSDNRDMSREKHLQRVIDCGIVAVVRFSDPNPLVEVIKALSDGGVTVAEVTLTVPNALDVIREVKRKLGDRVLLGAGTVLDPETARAALLAGAEFLVAPNLNLDVIKLCRRYDKLVMPGAFTPTEVVTAWEAGADIVKVFPADVVGPAFFKALRGPLPQVKLMPTGGVDLTTAAEFLKAGAVCLGVGGQLVDPKAVAAAISLGSLNWRSNTSRLLSNILCGNSCFFPWGFNPAKPSTHTELHSFLCTISLHSVK
jgi:2-dehydro-3-deoxyphosphogluconate aldolase / (4S)-4-hydroxy-2-oxoglutarate aldolase